MSDNAGKMPDKSKIRTKKCQLPKKWQKFDDLLLIPAGVEMLDTLDDLAEKYQGIVIRVYLNLETVIYRLGRIVLKAFSYHVTITAQSQTNSPAGYHKR